LYKGSDGVERYVKIYRDKRQGHAEATANAIYNDLGVYCNPNLRFLEMEISHLTLFKAEKHFKIKESQKLLPEKC